MARAALFTADDLTDLIGKPVEVNRATMVERVAWGWLYPILEVEDRPDDVPDELFAWAIELGAIAHENPAGLSAKVIGPFNEQYSSERRSEILAEVAASDLAGPGAAGRGHPDGCFPPPLPDLVW